MQLIDLTGRKLGRLTVLGRDTAPGIKHIRWECRCDCGEIKSVDGGALVKGRTKSCGCYKKDKGSWNRGIKGPESHGFKGTGKIPASYISDLRYRAAVRNLEFEITPDYLWALFVHQDGKCALTGLDIEFYSRGDIPTNAASVDRIDSSIGYVVGNVQWVDRRVNIFKSNLKQEDFIDLCKRVAKKHECT